MNIHDRTLDSGARLIVASPFPSELATVAITFHVGFAHEERRNLGVSHMLEHLCFSDNETRGFAEFRQAIDALGGRFNGFTSDLQTTYYIDLLKDHWKEGLSILKDITFNPRLSPEACKKEVKILLAETGQFKQKWLAWFYEKGWFRGAWTLMNDARWGERMHSRKTFHCYDDITPSELRAWHEQYYRPENMAIVAAGDLNIDDLADYLNELFCQHSEPTELDHPRPSPPTEPVTILTRLGIPFWNQSGVTIGAWNNGIGDDEKAVVDIAMDHLRNRAFDLLRLKHGLAYACWGYIATDKDDGRLTLHASIKRGQEARATELLEEVLGEVKSNPMSEDELHGLRNKMLSTYARKNALPSWYAFELMHKAFSDDPITLHDYPTLIKNVSPGDVQALVERLCPTITMRVTEKPLLTVAGTVGAVLAVLLTITGLVTWLFLK